MNCDHRLQAGASIDVTYVSCNDLALDDNQTANGILYDGNTVLHDMAKDIFGRVNSAGGI